MLKHMMIASIKFLLTRLQEDNINKEQIVLELSIKKSSILAATFITRATEIIML